MLCEDPPPWLCRGSPESAGRFKRGQIGCAETYPPATTRRQTPSRTMGPRKGRCNHSCPMGLSGYKQITTWHGSGPGRAGQASPTAPTQADASTSPRQCTTTTRPFASDARLPATGGPRSTGRTGTGSATVPKKNVPEATRCSGAHSRLSRPRRSPATASPASARPWPVCRPRRRADAGRVHRR